MLQLGGSVGIALGDPLVITVDTRVAVEVVENAMVVGTTVTPVDSINNVVSDEDAETDPFTVKVTPMVEVEVIVRVVSSGTLITVDITTIVSNVVVGMVMV